MSSTATRSSGRVGHHASTHRSIYEQQRFRERGKDLNDGLALLTLMDSEALQLVSAAVAPDTSAR